MSAACVGIATQDTRQVVASFPRAGGSETILSPYSGRLRFYRAGPAKDAPAGHPERRFRSFQFVTAPTHCDDAPANVLVIWHATPVLLGGDLFAVPPKDGLGRRERCHLGQKLSAEGFSLPGEQLSLGIDEAKTLGPEPIAEADRLMYSRKRD